MVVYISFFIFLQFLVKEAETHPQKSIELNKGL